MANVDIDIYKRYCFPHSISIVQHNDKIIVIAPDYANWIVLNSVEQLSILDFLKQGNTIHETLEQSFPQEDVNFVICQLEGRQFCSKQIHSAVEDERSMHLYLTNKCNLRCPHCYMFSGKSNEQELTTEEVIDVINKYRTIARGKRLTISGGEPTIRPDFERIIQYASKQGLEVKLLTNGSLFSKATIETLSNYIGAVQVSIDGFSEESNAIVRGYGHFQKALECVDTFIRNGVDTSIAITPPFDILKQHVTDFVIFAQQLIEKYSGSIFSVKFAESLSPGRNINPDKEQNEEYANLIKQIQTKIYGQEYEFIEFVQIMGNNIITDNCMFGVFAIASNGDVFLCPEIGKLHPIANVRTNSFYDICQKSLTAERATSVTKLTPCKNCELRYICGGGCRIEEFPEIIKLASFDSIQSDAILTRKCSTNIKEHFYELMIKSNDYLLKIPYSSI